MRCEWSEHDKGHENPLGICGVCARFPSQKSRDAFLREFAYYPLALGDAVSICLKQITWIDKFGGERSRSEGKKLLNRIIKRLNEEK